MSSQTGNDDNTKSEQDQDLWKNLISDIEKEYKDLFQWLLNQFDIKGHETWFRKKQLLEEAITNFQKILDWLLNLQQNELKLKNDIEQLQQGLKQSLEQLKKENDSLFKWLINLFEINDYRQQAEKLANKMKDTKILFAVFTKIQQNDISLKTEIDQLQKTDPQLFKWLLQCFGITPNYWASENLEKKMQDHKAVFDVFAQLSQLSVGNHQQQQSCRQEIEYLAKSDLNLFKNLLKLFNISENLPLHQQKQQLEIKLIDPISSVAAFSTFYKSYKDIYSQLQDTKNSENAIKQELEKLRQERQRIKELEAENESLRTRSNEMFATLSKQNRNETTTITSDDSRLQRDTLISDFKNLATQDFKRVTVQIFNHLMSINQELQNNRKQEEARIRSILSQRILITGIKWITENNNMSPESHLLTMKAKEITQMIVKDLSTESSNNIPDEITVSLEKLAQKGLELVRNIANDQPPGELWVEPEDKNFNFDKHEPMIGCEANGKILYTTYPGYRIGSRILEKAIVFTVPQSSEIVTNESQGDVDFFRNQIESFETDKTKVTEQNQDVSEKIKKLIALGITEVEISGKLGVGTQTIHKWEQGQNPAPENAQKLDNFYQEVMNKNAAKSGDLGNTEGKISYLAEVKIDAGTSYFIERKFPPGTNFHVKKGEKIEFDMMEKGEPMFNSETNTNDDIWWRVKGTNYWIPSAHIKLINS